MSPNLVKKSIAKYIALSSTASQICLKIKSLFPRCYYNNELDQHVHNSLVVNILLLHILLDEFQIG